MTTIFYDCEYTGLHQNTTLISIGLISEYGNTFYAELTDYDKSQVNDWIQTNVINNLTLKNWDIGKDYNPHSENVTFVGNMIGLSVVLSHWFEQFEEVEIWSDCLSYDWVLFCQIWGGAFNIPSNIFYMPFDLTTLFKIKNIDPDISREEFADVDINNKHNALHDAIVIKKCYEKLI